MSLSDAIGQLETKLEKALHDLWSCNQVIKVNAEAMAKLQNKYDRLLEDYNDTAGLRAEIMELKAQAKLNRESPKLAKAKETIKNLNARLAKEQSLRMKAENLPLVERENYRLNVQLEAMKKELPAHRENSRKVLQYQRENKLLMKLVDAHEARMTRAGVTFPGPTGVPMVEKTGETENA